MGELKIPLSLSGRADINRVSRELVKLDDFFLSANVRKSGTPIQPPRVSRILSNIAQENRLNLLKDSDRATLKSELAEILKSAPDLHISFAADPTPQALEKIISWLRTNIHPQAMIIVGLAPGLAAGMVLRTPNKVFDMSLSAYLKKQDPYLIKLIDEVARA